MSQMRSLEGGCSCGRITYTVTIPVDSADSAQVLFDNSHLHRHSQAPLSSYLRVPLTWYHSTTHAFFSDETHHNIRRTYASNADPYSQRHFCGFCGTPVSYWNERPEGEGEYICLALGSLRGSDLLDLEDLNLLPGESEELRDKIDAVGDEAILGSGALVNAEMGINEEHQGVPWFETLVQGSRLGRLRRSRGGGQSRDGSVKVEWEVTEWRNDDREREGEADNRRTTNPVIGTGKRKLEDSEGGDQAMQE